MCCSEPKPTSKSQKPSIPHKSNFHLLARRRLGPEFLCPLGRKFRWVRSLRPRAGVSALSRSLPYKRRRARDSSQFPYSTPGALPPNRLPQLPPRRLGPPPPAPRSSTAVLRPVRWFSHLGLSPPRRSAMSSGNASNPHCRVHLFLWWL